MISIFIPVYNGEHYLRRTLDSVLSQTYADWELLLVDDSSTDASYALLQEYAQSDPRLKVHRKPNGGDVPHAWEYAIPHLQGDFTLYMSQDDTLAPDCLSLLVERQQQTEADCIVPHVRYWYTDHDEREGLSDYDNSILSGLEAFRLMNAHRIPAHTLMRTDIIRRNGMDTDTYNADDLAQLRWIANCRTVAFSTGRFYYWQDNPDAITQRFSARHYSEVLTAARQTALVEQLLPSDHALHIQMHNLYFELLYKRHINFRQLRHKYTPPQRRSISYYLREAYPLLRRNVTLANWKFRLATQSYSLLLLVVRWKCWQLQRRHVILTTDLANGITW